MNNHHHNHDTAAESSGHHCACGKECVSCASDKVCVTAGCDMEAKQYEYWLNNELNHSEHAHDAERKEPEAAEAMVYTCPMHPEVRKSQPGRCPACGMELIASSKSKIKSSKSKHTGHLAHGDDFSKMSHMDHEAAMTSPQMAKKMEADMRRRFWISLALSIPIFLLSPVGTNILGLSVVNPQLTNWILFLLTTPIVFWTGSIFITGTYYSLRARKLNMAVLIATGVLAAYLFSVLLTFIQPDSETFYEAAALLVTFVLFGHWMEMRSCRGTSDAHEYTPEEFMEYIFSPQFD